MYYVLGVNNLSFQHSRCLQTEKQSQTIDLFTVVVIARYAHPITQSQKP
jgi:hypothetical protein